MKMLCLLYLNTIVSVMPADIQWVRRLASYGGKRKHLEVLVGVECPGKQFASLSKLEVCPADVSGTWATLDMRGLCVCGDFLS